MIKINNIVPHIILSLFIMCNMLYARQEFNPVSDMKRFISESPYKTRILELQANNEIQEILQEIIESAPLQTLEYIALGKNRIYPYSIKDEYQYSQYVYNWLLYLLKYNKQFLERDSDICKEYKKAYLDLGYNYPLVATKAIMAYIGNDYRQDTQYTQALQQDTILSNLYIALFKSATRVVSIIENNHCLEK